MSRFRTDKDRLRALDRRVSVVENAPADVSPWVNIAVPYTAFAAAGTAVYAKAAVLPAGAVLTSQVITLDQTFAASGASSMTVETHFLAEWNATPTAVSLLDGLATPSRTTVGAIGDHFVAGPDGAAIWLLASSNVNLNTLTAGLVTLRLRIEVPALPTFDTSICNVLGLVAPTTTPP
jgi:hypothetical protein